MVNWHIKETLFLICMQIHSDDSVNTGSRIHRVFVPVGPVGRPASLSFGFPASAAI
jgi:hypothetical protein